MASAPKVNPALELTRRVKEATQAATENVLRLTTDAGTGAENAQRAATIAQLAHICQEAAGHMAKAQTTMFEGVEGGEAAIEHLDAALLCLNKLADEGEKHKAKRKRAVKSKRTAPRKRTATRKRA